MLIQSAKDNWSVILTITVSLLFSCQQEENIKVQRIEPQKEFVAHLVSNPTRTSLVGSNVVWEASDVIAVYAGSNIKGSYYIKSGTENSTTATFVRDDRILSGTESFYKIEDGTQENQNLNSVDYQEFQANVSYYPYLGVYSCVENNGTYSLGVNLDSKQIYKKNGFSSGVLPMVAFTEGIGDNQLFFKNVCGLLKFKVKGPFKVNKLVFKGQDGENISGKGEIEISKNTPPGSSLEKMLFRL